MAAELRWILLGLSLPLLAGIWWWTARRSGQAPGDSALREPTVEKPAEIAPAPEPRYIDVDVEDIKPESASRDWGVSPFEPLNVLTADFDRVPVLEGPMMVSSRPEPLVAPAPAAAAAPMVATAPAVAPATMTATAAAVKVPPTLRAASAAGSPSDNSDRFAAVAPPAPNTAELQRIVTIRVCTIGEARWSGAQLVAALELHGLAFGRYQVFHRNHVDGRSLFCVASLIEPGTFDIAEMAEQEFRGITLFAVLPGPIEPLETMDELFGTARGLAEELSGMVQDAKGIPLSPQRAAALREDIARFQASLSRN